jgi:hypothetical protein
VCLGIILNGIMASSKNGLFCLLNPSKVAPLLGGEDGDGFLEGWLKTAKHRARFASLWSGDSGGSVSLVSPLANCLYFGALGVFIDSVTRFTRLG